ncbi:MAG: hypothetical protein AAGG44_05000, partial [Planctomycetota bacterium]
QGGAGGFGQGGQNLGGGFGQGIGGGQGAGQGIGFGQGGGQNGFGQGGGGFFRIEPDKKRRIMVQTVCLEHGKRDPNPRMPYQLVPLKNVSNNPAVEQLCRDLASGKIGQNTAQATTWNLENGLSWEQLAALNRRQSRWLGNESRFTATELKDAHRYRNQLLQQAEKTSNHKVAESTKSVDLPAEEDSLSSNDITFNSVDDSNPLGLRYR